jgi:aspartokinase
MASHQVKKISTVSGIVMQAQQAIIHITYLHGTKHYHALLSLLDKSKVFMGTLHLSRYKAQHTLLSFALPMVNMEKLQLMLKEQLGDDLEHIECALNQAQVSVIGVGIQSSERVFFQINEWMAKQRFSADLMTSSESRLSFYIDEHLAKSVVKDLHGLFHLQEIEIKNS